MSTLGIINDFVGAPFKSGDEATQQSERDNCIFKLVGISTTEYQNCKGCGEIFGLD